MLHHPKSFSCLCSLLSKFSPIVSHTHIHFSFFHLSIFHVHIHVHVHIHIDVYNHILCSCLYLNVPLDPLFPHLFLLTHLLSCHVLMLGVAPTLPACALLVFLPVFHLCLPSLTLPIHPPHSLPSSLPSSLPLLKSPPNNLLLQLIHPYIIHLTLYLQPSPYPLNLPYPLLNTLILNHPPL